MPKSEIIARHSAHPRGLFGHLVAHGMARDTARVNRRVIDLLEPKPGERVLELGCGHGRTLRRVAAAVAPGGSVVGVDPSDVMLTVAKCHLRRQIAAGAARVVRGSSDGIPEADGSFDRLYSVHTLYFWPALARGLREAHRVLRCGGELLLAFYSSDDARWADHVPSSIYQKRSRAEVCAALPDAGFQDADVDIDSVSGVSIARAKA